MARAHQVVLTDTVTALNAVGMKVAQACRLVGLPRSTYYRLAHHYTHYRRVADPVAHTGRHQPAALTEQERAAVVALLSDERHADLSVVQAFWRGFDEGVVSCSLSTCYRIARAEAMVGDRRRRKRTPGAAVSRRTPRVAATGPGQLWSWDATALRGPGRAWFKLAVAIDVYSRYPVAWQIEATESATMAVAMFTDAFARHGAPTVLHADNGAVMRSRDLLDALDAAGVLASFSRPRVSDDNPFSESLFKTIKYDLACPERFDDLDHARAWTTEFMDRYAHQHRHSGLGWHTPASVHDGTAEQIRAQRQAQLDANYQAHPQRFSRRPTAPQIPATVGINTKQQLSQAA